MLEAREFAQELNDERGVCSLETLHAMKRDMRCENGHSDSRCDASVDAGNEEEIGARTTLPVLPTETTIARATHPNSTPGRKYLYSIDILDKIIF